MFTKFNDRTIPERLVPVLVVTGLCFCTLWVMAGAAMFGSGHRPQALIGGMAVAAVLVVVYIGFALLIDPFEMEPPWMLAGAFLWGAIVAVPLAGWFNPPRNADFVTLLEGAFVEELVKAAPLFLFFFWKPDEFDDVIDGVVYATMIGLGFAMTENVDWYVNAWPNVWDTVLYRGILSPFSHPMFTVMTGIGLGIARERGSRLGALRPASGKEVQVAVGTQPHTPGEGRLSHLGAKFAAPPLLFVLAVLVHVEWNVFMAWWVLLPTFAFMVVVVWREQAREGETIGEHLEPYEARGKLSAEEVAKLCNLRRRMAALGAAYREAGLDGWRREARFQQVASELAFHRWRVVRGISRGATADKAREDEYLRKLAATRRSVLARQD